jgi:chemotaxis protein methyltransferase CheR
VTPEALDFLSELVRARTGVILQTDKGYFAESRLAPLARREGLDSVETLLANLRNHWDEKLAIATVDAMAIADTSFFRDRDVFDHIAKVMLPTVAAARPDGVVRVWCAGCSTGQEAYSIAMLAVQGEDQAPNLKVDIIGTDLSHRALEKAHSGLYTQFEVQRGLPIRLLLQHFERTGEMWRASERLRHAVRWRQLNLLEDRRSVRAFDILLCRNVIRYFEPATADRVLEQMASALAPDGFLVLGSGETTQAPSYARDPYGPDIYRKQPVAQNHTMAHAF